MPNSRNWLWVARRSGSRGLVVAELLMFLVPWFGWPMGSPDGEENVRRGRHHRDLRPLVRGPLEKRVGRVAGGGPQDGQEVPGPGESGRDQSGRSADERGRLVQADQGVVSGACGPATEAGDLAGHRPAPRLHQEPARDAETRLEAACEGHRGRRPVLPHHQGHPHRRHRDRSRARDQRRCRAAAFLHGPARLFATVAIPEATDDDHDDQVHDEAEVEAR